jgi:hypothetical protein
MVSARTLTSRVENSAKFSSYPISLGLIIMWSSKVQKLTGDNPRVVRSKFTTVSQADFLSGNIKSGPIDYFWPNSLLFAKFTLIR